MITNFYKIDCITNLHAGSGEENFNIVDNEVQKDPITGMPMLHASGVKGALRDLYAKNNPEKVDELFGTLGDKEYANGGTHKFFDAHLLARPMRVGGSDSLAYLPVVTVASVNQFLYLLSAFGKNSYGITKIDAIDFGGNAFLSTVPDVRVEDEATGLLPEAVHKQLSFLHDLIGEKFAVAASFDAYALPVVARNFLENGVCRNLWYEEVVPHGSVFYFAMMHYDDAEPIQIPEIVQFGGHSSIGCGYCKVTKL